MALHGRQLGRFGSDGVIVDVVVGGVAPLTFDDTRKLYLEFNYLFFSCTGRRDWHHLL